MCLGRCTHACGSPLVQQGHALKAPGSLWRRTCVKGEAMGREFPGPFMSLRGCLGVCLCEPPPPLSSRRAFYSVRGHLVAFQFGIDANGSRRRRLCRYPPTLTNTYLGALPGLQCVCGCVRRTFRPADRVHKLSGAAFASGVHEHRSFVAVAPSYRDGERDDDSPKA